MRTSSLAVLAFTLTTAAVLAQVAATPTSQRPAPAPAQPATQTPAPTGGQPPPVRRVPPKPMPTRLIVRDQRGTPLGDVHVSVLGPGDRSVATGADGRAELPAMPDGPYRLRFDRDGYFTLERDIAIKNAAPVDIAVVLNVAPSPAPPPLSQPAPAPASTPEPPKPAANMPPGPPVFLSIPTFLDRNFIGREPLKESMLSCTSGALTRLLQLRDPVADHSHADADEVIYVVAGEGAVRVGTESTTVTAGSLVVLSRGTTHGLERRGRNPLIVLSTLSSAPCPMTAGVGRGQ